MNKIALHINEILVVPEQEWWKFEARLARIFERWVVFQMRLSSRWQGRIHGCHGSTMILRDVEQLEEV